MVCSHEPGQVYGVRREGASQYGRTFEFFLSFKFSLVFVLRLIACQVRVVSGMNDVSVYLYIYLFSKGFFKNGDQIFNYLLVYTKTK